MAGWRGEAESERRTARSRQIAEEDEAPRRTAQNFLGLSGWPSRNFKSLVEEKEVEAGETEAALRSYDDPEVNGACDALEQLELDSAERQQTLCKVYSLESEVYHEMNRALREDDAEVMGRLAPYIKELRDVFLTDHINQVITPFTGTVWRGVRYDEPDQALEQYERDHDFAWPSFSSTSVDSNIADGFGGGGLIFEIRCYPPDGTYEDDTPEFAPASISEWSASGGEQEVLFPPNVKFRVVNVKHPSEENGLEAAVVQCETVDFESIWKMVQDNNTDGVKRWLKHNPDRVNTEDCRHHLLDELDSDSEESSDEESEGHTSREAHVANPGNLRQLLRQAGAKRGEGKQKEKCKRCTVS